MLCFRITCHSPTMLRGGLSPSPQILALVILGPKNKVGTMLPQNCTELGVGGSVCKHCNPGPAEARRPGGQEARKLSDRGLCAGAGVSSQPSQHVGSQAGAAG